MASESRLQTVPVEAEYTLENGHRADLYARRNGVRVAVEVETGKSNAESNVAALQIAGIDRMLILATTIQARERIRAQLPLAAGCPF